MKQCAFFVLLVLLCSNVIFAQNADGGADPVSPPEIKEDIFNTAGAINQFGDQYIQISGMVNIPFQPPKINIGGTGLISYSFYFAKWFSVGAGVGFAYSSTLGNNVFYFVPILLKPTFHFYIWRFEFAVSAAIGGAFEAYTDRNYFGFIAKPELAVFYRFLPNWSIGINTGLNVLPQWYQNTAYNRTGLIMDAGVSVRYHF